MGPHRFSDGGLAGAAAAGDGHEDRALGGPVGCHCDMSVRVSRPLSQSLVSMGSPVSVGYQVAGA